MPDSKRKRRQRLAAKDAGFMTTEKINAICRQRLERWGKKLVREHGTPVLLLGIGHDHKSGQLITCMTTDLTDAQLKAAVEFLHKTVCRQGHTGGGAKRSEFPKPV